jgi:transcriptional regulator with XRE-family HTH domain
VDFATNMKVTHSESLGFTIGNVMMMLKDYLSQNGLSLKGFADQCGLSAPTILRARDGINIPSRRTLEAIVTATKGAVTIQDLIRVELKDDVP